MRQAKFKHPITAYVSDEIFKIVQDITMREKISIAEWLRSIIELQVMGEFKTEK